MVVKIEFDIQPSGLVLGFTLGDLGMERLSDTGSAVRECRTPLAIETKDHALARSSHTN